MALPMKDGRPRETIRVVSDHEIPNAPGMSLIGLEVDFPPNGATPPHRHGGAFVNVFVIEGHILSGMNGNPPEVYPPGGTFMELPGCHHTVAENNSKTEGAKLVAYLIVETATVKKVGYGGLTVIDEEWK